MERIAVDVLVAGGGVAGLTATAAFAAGFRVLCVDPVPPGDLGRGGGVGPAQHGVPGAGGGAAAARRALGAAGAAGGAAG